MTQWDQADFERVLNCTFTRVDCEPGFDWLEARFSSRGLHFLLVINARNEWIWLRSDPLNPDQATPAFEFTFRSDRIRIIHTDSDTEAVQFEFSDGCNEPDPKHIRLVIEQLPSGDLYVWPILGAADRVHPGLEADLAKA